MSSALANIALARSRSLSQKKRCGMTAEKQTGPSLRDGPSCYPASQQMIVISGRSEAYRPCRRQQCIVIFSSKGLNRLGVFGPEEFLHVVQSGSTVLAGANDGVRARDKAPMYTNQRMVGEDIKPIKTASLDDANCGPDYSAFAQLPQRPSVKLGSTLHERSLMDD